MATADRSAAVPAPSASTGNFRLPSLGWRQIGLAIYLGLNIGLILYQPWDVGFTRDWQLWQSLPAALERDNLYGDLGVELPFVWSPFMAPTMAAVVALGFWPWAVLHVVALFLLRDWRLIALILCSWGFWTDVAGANTFVFVVVTGALAWRGNRTAALIYLVLLFLMPRPIQLPLAALLLARMPEIRWPALVLFLSHAAVVFASGYAVAWMSNMVDYANTTPHDLGPRFFIGSVWLGIALVIAAWLTWKQRPGWAGLFASAYWLPQYFLMPLVDWSLKPTEESADGVAPQESATTGHAAPIT